MNSQPRRRVRRHSTDNDNDAVIDFLRRSPTEPSPIPRILNLNPKLFLLPLLRLGYAHCEAIATIANDDLDPIRAELLNDFHHQNFSESDYWDESHNWSDDGELASDEYWHFVGLYE